MNKCSSYVIFMFWFTELRNVPNKLYTNIHQFWSTCKPDKISIQHIPVREKLNTKFVFSICRFSAACLNFLLNRHSKI